MNTRKLLARLGPKTPQLTRLMHGTGGFSSPDSLSPQDIAAALGFIKTRPGRDLYEYLWVPNMNSNMARRSELTQAFAAELRDEQGRRVQAGSNRFPDPPAKLCMHSDGRKSIYRYCVRIAETCLTELTKRNDCPSCNGFGEVLDFFGDDPVRSIMSCPTCVGAGTVPFGKASRAKLIGVRREVFCSHVEASYVWLLGYMREQEVRAASEHWEAMRD